MRDVTEEFNGLLKENGYKSVLAFCKDAGIDRANLDKNIKGVFKLSLERAFIIARTLCVPIETVLWVFYPDEMIENINNITTCRKF